MHITHDKDGHHQYCRVPGCVRKAFDNSCNLCKPCVDRADAPDEVYCIVVEHRYLVRGIKLPSFTPFSQMHYSPAGFQTAVERKAGAA